jgi:predicted RNA-binding Zn-ribbon protein involved in translation (DUF1610 family)
MKTHSGSINIPNRTCQIPSETIGAVRNKSQTVAVTAKELARRVAIERAHDHASTVVHARTKAELDIERDARAGLCPQCGERIGNVDRCPICGTPLWEEKIAEAVGMVQP